MRFALGLLGLGVAMGCTSQHSPIEELSSNRKNSAIGFAEVSMQILQPHCLSCHRSYESYGQVRAELESIVSSINAERMPKSSPPLNQRQKDLINNWLVQGSPEVAGQPDADPAVPLAPNWNSVLRNIFAPKCVVCHNPAGQARFLDLSSRQQLFRERAKYLNFDQPEKSRLLEIIQDPSEPMPPKSSNIRAVAESELQVLKEWISLGLP